MSTNTSSLHIFQILRFVAERDQPVALADIAKQLDLPTTTAYRGLATLVETDYLSRDEGSGRYALGDMPQFLSRALFRRFALRDAAWPIMKRLAGTTGETVTLAVRLGWYGVRIAAAFGAKGVYEKSRLGATQLLHRSRAMWPVLALLEDDEIDAYRRFVRVNEPALAAEVDRGAFAKDLRSIRARGFVAIPAPLGAGFQIAMPIRDAGGRPVASVRINGSVLDAADAAPDARIKGWLTECGEIERALAADPERFKSPFAHINVDAIRLRPSA